MTPELPPLFFGQNITSRLMPSSGMGDSSSPRSVYTNGFFIEAVHLLSAAAAPAELPVVPILEAPPLTAVAIPTPAASLAALTPVEAPQAVISSVRACLASFCTSIFIMHTIMRRCADSRLSRPSAVVPYISRGRSTSAAQAGLMLLSALHVSRRRCVRGECTKHS